MVEVEIKFTQDIDDFKKDSVGWMKKEAAAICVQQGYAEYTDTKQTPTMNETREPKANHEAMMTLLSGTPIDCKEIEILVQKLEAADLGTQRFLKVGDGKLHFENKKYPQGLYEDKAAFESGFQERLYDYSKQTFETWPRWGVCAGNCLVLVDYDKKETYEILKPRLPNTFEVTSPRHKLPHQYFVVWGKQVPNLKLHIKGDTYVNAKGATVKNPSGEIRADDHYTVAPGTTIRYQDLETKAWILGKYYITNDVKIAGIEFDDFMKAFDGYLMEGAGERILTDDKLRNGVSVGERHDIIYRYACRLVGDNHEGGFPENVALEMLHKYNDEKLYDEAGKHAPIEDAYLKRVIENGINTASKATGINADKIAKLGFTIIREAEARGKGSNSISAMLAPEPAPTPQEEMSADMVKGNLEVQLEEELAIVQPAPTVLKKDEKINPANVADSIVSQYNIVTDVTSKTIYFYQRKQGIYNPMGEVILEKIVDKTLHQHNRPSIIEAVLGLVRIKTYTQTTPSTKLALSNGLFELVTGKLSSFTPNEFVINKFDITYQEGIVCQEWIDFIDKVCPTDKLLLQEWSGYLLLRGYPYHAIMWLYGPTGRNGKGVWARTMQGILGEQNYSSVSIDEFDGKHRFALYNLKDSLFNISPEPRTDKSLTIELLQSLSGQDAIDAESKRIQARFRFKNPAKITVMGNKFPTIEAPTDAFWERLKLCKFPNRFVGSEQIVDLEHTWLDDQEKRSGIFNWMYQGYQRLNKQGGFSTTKTQEETILQFKRASDTVGAWFIEGINFAPDKYESKVKAFEHYKKYCDSLGIPSVYLNLFADKLRNHPKIKDTSHIFEGKKTKAWQGFGLVKLVDENDGVEEKKTEQKTLPTGTGGTVGTTPHTQLEKTKFLEYKQVSTEGGSVGSSGSESRVCGDCSKKDLPSCSYPGDPKKLPIDHWAGECRGFLQKQPETPDFEDKCQPLEEALL